MLKKPHGKGMFYGTATLGEKGQAVIPSKARTVMKLKKGEKLLVFGMGNDMLIFSKLSNLEKFASDMASHLGMLRTIIKKTGRK
ncbi:MAG: AbrB/MazE/SpoVT family DNA-binding domain-containing protein [Candidatus Liptonbacteria bacterium]|nr:AbrB/MazE/SpoVT family DNA-binding domain-containing protein [Candidatus Liptonbacteria bacterium]